MYFSLGTTSSFQDLGMLVICSLYRELDAAVAFVFQSKVILDSL